MTDLLFWVFALGSVIGAWRVFRASSMVRAAYWLLASFLGVAGVLVLLRADFLGLVLILMMAGEMTIMAIFMVMLMMNPAGLNPMVMVHQHRAAIGAGAAAFLGLGAVGLFGRFPDRPGPTGGHPTAELGMELLGDSMLVFETAGIALLATMVGAIAVATRRGRFGNDDLGSQEPALQPGTHTAAAPARGPEENHGMGQIDPGAVKPDITGHGAHG
ncbi:MAG: NADH-quinone oxidoreductase subunit J [Gemmatimonadales bacterium]|nr:NADH-quinone oxidoreductase subunit J [Gemmatimonadales bacterium]